MSTLANILIFTFIGSLASLAGGFLLLAKEKLAYKISHVLASFAAGALLGTAFFDLMPEAAEAVEESGGEHGSVFLWVIIGIIVFYLLERGIHWFHHHSFAHEEEKGHDHPHHKKPIIPLIMLGDSMHNFIDGVAIAITFMVNPSLGIVTALAVAAHEIPQEIGDFGVMLHEGLKRKKVILFNIASASIAFLGAILAFLLGEQIEGILPTALALTSGFFIYIALSDILPEIHHEEKKGYAIAETVSLLLGIIVVYFSISLLHGAGGH